MKLGKRALCLHDSSRRARVFGGFGHMEAWHSIIRGFTLVSGRLIV